MSTSDSTRFSYPRSLATVSARQGYAVTLSPAERLQIVDQSGRQTAVLVAFRQDDLTEWASPAHTREETGSIMLGLAKEIVSNRRLRMLRVEEDTVGRHDMLMPACDGRRYLDHFGLPDHPSCQDILTNVLREHGITFDRLPDPFNFFMHTAILRFGELEVREPLSEAGDFVVLRALTNLVVGIAACPQDRTAQNGQEPTDLLVRVFRE